MKVGAGLSGCGGFKSFFFLKLRPEGNGFDGISTEVVAGPSGGGGFEPFFLKLRPEGNGFDGISTEVVAGPSGGGGFGPFFLKLRPEGSGFDISIESEKIEIQ